MDNLAFLLAAYGVFWTLTFILVFSVWLRQRRLEQQIAALAARLEDDTRE